MVLHIISSQPHGMRQPYCTEGSSPLTLYLPYLTQRGPSRATLCSCVSLNGNEAHTIFISGQKGQLWELATQSSLYASLTLSVSLPSMRRQLCPFPGNAGGPGH